MKEASEVANLDAMSEREPRKVLPGDADADAVRRMCRHCNQPLGAQNPGSVCCNCVHTK